MKIEVGKAYLSKAGEKVLIDFDDGSGHFQFCADVGDERRSYDEYGRRFTGPHGEETDLVSEFVEDTREHTGGSVTYYGIELADGTKVQCNDVIKALNMTYAEGNVFKAVWRIAAARQGKSKRGYDDALYDSEKVVFFGGDMVEAAKAVK